MPKLTKLEIYRLLLNENIDRAADIIGVTPNMLRYTCEINEIPIPDKTHYLYYSGARETYFSSLALATPHRYTSLEVSDAKHFLCKNFGRKKQKSRPNTMYVTRPRNKGAVDFPWKSFCNAYQRWLSCQQMEKFVSELEAVVSPNAIISGSPASHWFQEARQKISDHNPVFGKPEAIFRGDKTSSS